LEILGPGLVTGASDDDPSGIATYSQAGAQFGYLASWTLVFTYVDGGGADDQCPHRPNHGPRFGGQHGEMLSALVGVSVTIPLLIANVINLGADLGPTHR
jgi:hypothetical protein